MIVIGIDPGMSGGIAVIDEESVTAIKMPETNKDLLDAIQSYVPPTGSGCAVFIERVNAGPKMASRAAFSFGQNVAAIQVACLAAKVRIEYIQPAAWQKEFSLLVKGRALGENDTDKKRRNKARAQELFPMLKITNYTADALLIALYGQRRMFQMT